MNPKLKVEFAPGCFDDFEGTQEELDTLIQQIQDYFAEVTPDDIEADENLLDLDYLLEEDPELYEEIVEQMQRRTLQ